MKNFRDFYLKFLFYKDEIFYIFESACFRNVYFMFSPHPSYFWRLGKTVLYAAFL